MSNQPIIRTQDGWEVTGKVTAEYCVDGEWRTVTDDLRWFMAPDANGEPTIPAAEIPTDWDLADLRVTISDDRWEYDESTGNLQRKKSVA